MTTSIEVPAKLLDRLSRREAEVLALYALNMTVPAIADALGIKRGTVDSYLHNITATVRLDRNELRRELDRRTSDTTTVRVRMREGITATTLEPAHSRTGETGDGRAPAARPLPSTCEQRPSQPSTDQDRR